MNKKISLLKNRIYSDYFMPSRLQEYEEMVKKLCEHDYEFITFKAYCRQLNANRLKNRRYFINRHDIDTDVSTAKAFFEIEKKYNVKATYYFRLSTLDIDFMKELEAYGSEASYHFEEIAQFCKDNHIKTKSEVFEQMDTIKDIFCKNIATIEERLGIKIKTVCSHGDFVNRKLAITNNALLEDENLRKRCGIECETYDKKIMGSFDIYIADRPYPQLYFPRPVFEYIGKKNIICMLTHPRQWKVNWTVNTADNIKRIYEGIVW